MDYGCLVYGSAAKSVLAKLDDVQVRALKLCTGVILLLGAGEAPLRLQHTKLAINNWATLKGLATAPPSFSQLEQCWEFEKGGNRINRHSYIFK